MSAQDRGARARHAGRGLRLVVPGDPTQPVVIEHPYLQLISPRTADGPPTRADIAPIWRRDEGGWSARFDLRVQRDGNWTIEQNLGHDELTDALAMMMGWSVEGAESYVEAVARLVESYAAAEREIRGR